jgi:HIV Tat-specific factor 1
LDWFDEENTQVSDKLAKIVILKHMFTLEELEQDPRLLLDLTQDVREECEKLGKVTNVILYDLEPEGVMSVKFKEVSSAATCAQVNMLNNY